MERLQADPDQHMFIRTLPERPYSEAIVGNFDAPSKIRRLTGNGRDPTTNI